MSALPLAASTYARSAGWGIQVVPLRFILLDSLCVDIVMSSRYCMTCVDHVLLEAFSFTSSRGLLHNFSVSQNILARKVCCTVLADKHDMYDVLHSALILSRSGRAGPDMPPHST